MMAIENNKGKWHVDKKGVIVNTMIVTPILESLRKIINEQIRKTENNIEEMTLLVDLVTDIDSGVLSKEVIKYIAPYFNLEKENDILVEPKKKSIKVTKKKI
jgi:hypothetical protein